MPGLKEPNRSFPISLTPPGEKGPRGRTGHTAIRLILHHVAYLIEASPVLTEKANRPRVKPPDDEEGSGPDSVTKYVAIFRAARSEGQCFHRPYLGCREFACHFAPPDETEHPLKDWNERLGFMLYDLRFPQG